MVAGRASVYTRIIYVVMGHSHMRTEHYFQLRYYVQPDLPSEIQSESGSSSRVDTREGTMPSGCQSRACQPCKRILSSISESQKKRFQFQHFLENALRRTMIAGNDALRNVRLPFNFYWRLREPNFEGLGAVIRHAGNGSTRPLHLIVLQPMNLDVVARKNDDSRWGNN